jgi:1-acyl-sn-glycerol-3-phosphate acyltransferase
VYNSLGERLSFWWRDILWFLLKIFIGLPLRIILRSSSKGRADFPPRGQPAFILASHTNTLDPFIVAAFIKRPICFVVTDDDFRFGFTRMLLGWLKVIPTAKNVPDYNTMRMLIEAVKHRQIIALSSESGRNWDGIAPPLNETIPRLVRRLQLPVICLKMRGAYLTWPRWTNWPRRGRIILEFSYLFKNPDEIPEDEAQIAQKISEKVCYSELNDEEVIKHSFRRANIAQYLELRLWLCPHCMEFFVLKSEGRYLYCTRCGATWAFRANGTFILKKSGDPLSPQARNFKRYLDWASYNDTQTMPILLDRIKAGERYLVSLPAEMKSDPAPNRRDLRFKHVEEGTVKLTSDFRMVFIRNKDNETLLDVPLVKMKGVQVVWNNILEFCLPHMTYRISFYGQSAYFWHLLIKQLRKTTTHVWKKANR